MTKIKVNSGSTWPQIRYIGRRAQTSFYVISKDQTWNIKKANRMFKDLHRCPDSLGWDTHHGWARSNAEAAFHEWRTTHLSAGARAHRPRPGATAVLWLTVLPLPARCSHQVSQSTTHRHLTHTLPWLTDRTPFHWTSVPSTVTHSLPLKTES